MVVCFSSLLLILVIGVKKHDLVLVLKDIGTTSEMVKCTLHAFLFWCISLACQSQDCFVSCRNA